MYWTPVDQELPRVCQEIIIEDRNGSKMVALYRPEFECPWIVTVGFNEKGGRVYGFFAQLSNEDVAYWSNIDVRVDD